MATYVINAASSSPGSPWATESTGAQSFKQLFDDITQADGDIVEVYDNAEIDDSVFHAATITKDVTIRSHSSNASKPIVKTDNDNSFLAFVAAGVTGNPKIQGIRMYKAGPSASNAFIGVVNGAFSSPEISDCEFWIDDPTNKDANVVAVTGNETASFSGALIFKNNKVYDLSKAVSFGEHNPPP